MRFLGETKSLLLTGLADVWAAAKERSGRPGERAGLELFYRYAREAGVVRSIAALDFYEG